MSCIDIAHEKKAAVFEPLLSLFWALLAELSRTFYLDFEIFGFIRIFEYPKFGFPPEKDLRNSGKFTRSFFRLFSNLLNIKSRSDTVIPVCYENYE